jgi:hypothetical protein
VRARGGRATTRFLSSPPLLPPQIYPTGAVVNTNWEVYAGNTAYEYAGLSCFNTSACYIAATGGSGNGNSIYFMNTVTGWGPGKISVYGTSATTYQVRRRRLIQRRCRQELAPLDAVGARLPSMRIRNRAA